MSAFHFACIMLIKSIGNREKTFVSLSLNIDFAPKHSNKRMKQ